MKQELSNDAKKIVRNNIELWKWISLGVFVVYWTWKIYVLYFNDESKLKVDFINFIAGFILGIMFLCFLLFIWRGFASWKNNYK